MSDLTAKGRPRQRRTSAARVAHSKLANRLHGLKAVEPLPSPTSPAVRELGTVGAVRSEVETMYQIAIWVAQQLKDAAPLTPADRLSVFYADLAGRANEAAIAIDSGTWHWRFRNIAESQVEADGRAQAIERQAVITAHILSRSKRAAKWLMDNGVIDNGKPRGVLNYYGGYLSAAIRKCLTMAALLAEPDGDGASSASALIEQFREGDNAESQDR